MKIKHLFNYLPIQITQVKYQHPLNHDHTSTDKMSIIKKTVCDYFGIDFETIRSKTRKHPIAQARQICVALIYVNCPSFGLHYIGHHFGNRDHTTIIHSFDAVKEKLDLPFSDFLKDSYLDIIEKLPFEAKPLKRRFFNQTK